MGMFDHIRCERPLPDGNRGERFQTKDFGCTLDQYTITADGHLVGPLGRVMFHGMVNFYNFDADHNWHEYVAKFTDGQLVDIRQIVDVVGSGGSGA